MLRPPLRAHSMYKCKEVKQSLVHIAACFALPLPEPIHSMASLADVVGRVAVFLRDKEPLAAGSIQARLPDSKPGACRAFGRSSSCPLCATKPRCAMTVEEQLEGLAGVLRDLQGAQQGVLRLAAPSVRDQLHHAFTDAYGASLNSPMDLSYVVERCDLPTLCLAALQLPWPRDDEAFLPIVEDLVGFLDNAAGGVGEVAAGRKQKLIDLGAVPLLAGLVVELEGGSATNVLRRDFSGAVESLALCLPRLLKHVRASHAYLLDKPPWRAVAAAAVSAGRLHTVTGLRHFAKEPLVDLIVESARLLRLASQEEGHDLLGEMSAACMPFLVRALRDDAAAAPYLRQVEAVGLLRDSDSIEWALEVIRAERKRCREDLVIEDPGVVIEDPGVDVEAHR